MDKYTLLILLNLPFVLFGYLRAVTMYKMGSLQRIGYLLRLLFWSFILLGLVFAEQIYDFARTRNLSDTQPMSLADVMLVTGVIFSLSLCLRLYAKIEQLEKRTSDLHEKLSIQRSKN